ncbi:MAG: ATP-binding protein [Actinomycetota bacterium]
MTALDADNEARLRRKLDRATQENQILAELIEEKTRSLFLAQEDLRHSRDYLENILNSIQSAVIITDGDGRITAIGGTTAALTGRPADELRGLPLSTVLAFSDAAEEVGVAAGAPRQAELLPADGNAVPVLVTSSALGGDEQDPSQADGEGQVVVATDISERRRLEVELRHAQRMESIGQLAAGVAHEINTPVQFVGDSITFMGDVLTDLLALVDDYRQLTGAVATDGQHADLLATIAAKEEEVDLEFVTEEGPNAVARTLTGIERVTSIIGALRQFSHTSGDAMAPTDLNQVVENTLVVAAGEYKYVAEVECDLQPVPEVMADAGDLGQVFINILVNAAHAIGEHPQPDGAQGRITIGSRLVDGGVAVTITDTGGGIPQAIQDRVFEPFFTTKEVGSGTGQGLSLAHNVVVGKHGGRLEFEVDPGVGTTFTVWLPAEGA